MRKGPMPGNHRRNRRRLALLLEVLEQRVLLSAYTMQPIAALPHDEPPTSLCFDHDGNIYGLTNNPSNVIEINRSSGVVTILASYTGATLYGPIVVDAGGDVFGTTSEETVFEVVNGSGTVTFLGNPGSTLSDLIPGLVADSAGNIYGIAEEEFGDTSFPGIFEIPAGTDSIVPLVPIDPPGYGPISPPNSTLPGLSIDQSGNLYGLFSISTTSTASTFTTNTYAFELQKGASSVSISAELSGPPSSQLTIDTKGNIYGAYSRAGDFADFGSLFEIPEGSGTAVTLASFDGVNGSYPAESPIVDSSGNLFGAAAGGYFTASEILNDGAIYELQAGATSITPLIVPGNDAWADRLIADSAGTIFGVSGPNDSSSPDQSYTIFQLIPSAGTIGSAAQMLLTQEPAEIAVPTQNGTVGPPLQIRIVDSDFEVVTSDHTTATLSIFSGPAGASLNGDLSVPVVAGIATFDNFALSKPGQYVIQVTDAADSLSVVSWPFTLNSVGVRSTTSTASQLVFLNVPTMVQAGLELRTPLQVALEDQNSDIVTTSKGTVTLIIAAGPSTGLLEGSVTGMLTNGVATFTNLSVSSPGQYTIGALLSSKTNLLGLSSPIVAVSNIELDPPVTDALGPGDVVAPGPLIPNLSPTLFWETALGATGYGLYIEDTKTGTFVYPDANGSTTTQITGSSFTIPSGILIPGHSYEWYMTSFSGNTETTNFSVKRFFRTAAVPGNGLPNLVPERLTLSGYSGQAGQTITVHWTVANTGTAAAPPTATGIRWGTSATNYLGTDLIPDYPTPAIAAGNSTIQSATITIPIGASAGTYYIWIIADNSVPSVLTQSNTQDDFAVSEALTVTVQAPSSYVYGEDFGVPRNSDLTPGTVNWSHQLLVSSNFVYIKASQDTVGDFLPPNMPTPSSKLAVGVYDLADPTQYYDPTTKQIRSVNPISPLDPNDVVNDAKEEADFFYKTAQAYLVAGYLLPALDLEYSNGFGFNNLWTGSTAGRADIAEWVNAWTEELDSLPGMADIKPILYMNTTFAGLLQSQLKSYKLWITLGSVGRPNLDPSGGGWTPSQWNWAIEQYQFSKTTYPPDLDVLNPTLSGGLASLEIGESGSMASIQSVSVSSTVITPSGNVRINFVVSAFGPMTLLLGSSLQLSAGGMTVNMVSSNPQISLVSGVNHFSVEYTVPNNVSSGAYDLLSQLWLDVDGNGQIDAPPDIPVGSVVDTECVLRVPGLVPLMTAVGPTWNQDGTIDGLYDGSETWNAYTPQYVPNDTNPNPLADRNVTGCVATAVAQVLYYWKEKDPTFQSVPIDFTRSADAYWFTSYAPDNPGHALTYVDADSSMYDFLPFQSTSGESLDSALAAVQYDGNPDSKALLSFAVGVAAKMQYGPGESSAYIGLPLLQMLGFESAKESNDWGSIESTVIANVAMGEPVVAGIFDNKGNGHCVVIDGYDPSRGLFHVDLGWGPGGDNEPGNGQVDDGTGDWYALSSDNQEIKAGGYDFTDIGVVLYNINPSLAAPANTTASQGAFSDKVQVSWDAAPQAVAYQVWRNTTDDPETAQVVSSIPVVGNSFNDTNVLPGQTYYYWVQPESDIGQGNLSAGVTGSVAEAATTVPEPKIVKSFSLGKPITLQIGLTSAAVHTLPFSGTATIVDSTQNVLGTAAVSPNGTVSWSLLNVPAGTYECTADFGGDGSHASAQSPDFTLVVNPAPISLKVKSKAMDPVLGQPNELTATVVPPEGLSLQPTGTLTFWNGSTQIGQVALNGGTTASLPISSASVGQHKFTATYGGDSNFVASKPAALTVKVQKDKVVAELLEVTPGPIYVGQTFNLTATLAVAAPGVGIPTGQITFKDGAHVLGTSALQANGTAVFPVNFSTAGTHKITAVYAGDPSDLGVTSKPLVQVASKAPTTLGLSPSAENGTGATPITFSATVTRNAPAAGVPTGVVVFQEGTKVLAKVSLTNGVAAWVASTLPIGSVDITAVYQGSTNDDPSQNDATLLITA